MAKKQKTTGKNQPDIKCKAGVFQLAAWKKTRIIPAKNDFDIEREVEQVNLCLTTGIRRNGEWKNVPVWFRLSQFANLKEMVDDFAEKLKELNGVEESGQK
jgi:hypothetical protein